MNFFLLQKFFRKKKKTKIYTDKYNRKKQLMDT